MIHVLHGYLAAAIIKPDVHAVSLCYGPCTFHDAPLLLCNTIAPGKDCNRVPAVQCSSHLCKEQPLTPEPV